MNLDIDGVVQFAMQSFNIVLTFHIIKKATTTTTIETINECTIGALYRSTFQLISFSNGFNCVRAVSITIIYGKQNLLAITRSCISKETIDSTNSKKLRSKWKQVNTFSLI